jgi:hypothetical protein
MLDGAGLRTLIAYNCDDRWGTLTSGSPLQRPISGAWIIAIHSIESKKSQRHFDAGRRRHFLFHYNDRSYCFVIVLLSLNIVE